MASFSLNDIACLQSHALQIPQEANAWSRLGTALLGLDRYEALVAQLRAVKLPGSRTARAQRSLELGDGLQQAGLPDRAIRPTRAQQARA